MEPGVDTTMFSPRRRRRRLRAQLLGDGTLLLLSVGRVSPEKRLDVLLASFELAAAEERGLRLVVVGDGPARAELQAKDSPSVQFLRELHGSDLAEVYASADVFCFPSTTDTFGQVLLEAGASGLPVVAAAAGGALDLVQHGANGLLVPPGDAAALAQAIVRLARSDGLRRELASCGLERAETRTWSGSFAELRCSYRLVASTTPELVLRSRAA